MKTDSHALQNWEEDGSKWREKLNTPFKLDRHQKEPSCKIYVQMLKFFYSRLIRTKKGTITLCN